MKKPMNVTGLLLFWGFFWLLFQFAPSPLRAQIFMEEGLQRGVDAVISTIGLGGAGCSAVDFDQDGDDDLTLGSNGEIYFYENIDGHFELLDLGVTNPPGILKGVLWADINNDEHLDLFITSYNGGLKLYKNIGDLQFEDITETSGISNANASNWGINLGDINRDGYLDLQLCRYRDWFTIPDNPSLQPDLWTRFYLNNGDETFTDVTEESGLVIQPSPVFQGVFFDFNNDLWPDNHTIIDRVPGNRLFVSNEGSFNDITEGYNMSYPNNDIMSNSVADYDNDGYLDLFMTNNGGPGSPTFLLKNEAGMSFSNVTSAAGVEVFEFGWAAVWLDADNDGWQDLFFSTLYNQPNYFFVNEGGTFSDQSDQIGPEAEVPSFSASKGDFDNDGFYDLIVQSRDPNRSILLMNQEEENHFIKLTPHGTVSNRMAVGAWIKVYAEGNQYVHYTLCGEGYMSQHSQHLIFGLGQSATMVDSLKILYPSGHEDVYHELAADSTYHFYEGETFIVHIESEDTLICQGENTTLDAGEHENYTWNTGETTRYITVDTAGIYSVSVENMYGIQSTAEIEIDILSNPVISESISPNPCSGDSLAAISLQNLLGIAADSVSWDNGMTGENIDSLAAGEYGYVFTDLNGCQSSGSASIIDPPELLVFANSNPEYADQSNGSIFLTIFGGVAPYTIYLDGEPVEIPISNLSSDTYALIVTDAYGCSTSLEVMVDNTLNAGSPSPRPMLVYPNPTEGKLYVRADSEIERVVIYNSTGLTEENYSTHENLINLEKLASGVYYLKIEFSNATTGAFRVLKN
jgi:hypothetical protein